MRKEFTLKLQKTPISRYISTEVLAEPMEHLIRNIHHHYHIDDCDFLIELARCQKLVIHYTKQEDYEQVKELNDIANKILLNLSSEGRKLGEIFSYPAIAYYYSKIGNIKLARKMIYSVIELDDDLFSKFPILHIHKLHHLLNTNKLFIYEKKHIECANLFLDIADYHFFSTLPMKYGKGDRNMIDKIFNNFGADTICENYIREYFLCMWNNPEVEEIFINNSRIDRIISDKSVVSCFTLQALRDFWDIQHSNLNSSTYKKIILFFHKYDTHFFDTLKLLLIRNTYLKENDIIVKQSLLNFIREKLHFENAEEIIRTITIHKKYYEKSPY